MQNNLVVYTLTCNLNNIREGVKLHSQLYPEYEIYQDHFIITDKTLANPDGYIRIQSMNVQEVYTECDCETGELSCTMGSISPNDHFNGLIELMYSSVCRYLDNFRLSLKLSYKEVIECQEALLEFKKTHPISLETDYAYLNQPTGGAYVFSVALDISTGSIVKSLDHFSDYTYNPDDNTYGLATQDFTGIYMNDKVMYYKTTQSTCETLGNIVSSRYASEGNVTISKKTESEIHKLCAINILNELRHRCDNFELDADTFYTIQSKLLTDII